MKPFEPSKSVFAEINVKLLMAFLLAATAIWMWPTSSDHDWGWGLMSIFLSIAAFGLFIEAIKLIGKIRTFEKDQKVFTAQGKEVKSSTLASNERMRKDGVFRNGN